MFDAALTTNPYITGIGFADHAPFEGDRISRYQKVSGEMELLWKTIVIGRPFDDGEKIIQDIFKLHSERMGRRVRVTSGMRHILLRLYGLFHQYRKTTEAIVIPASRFGSKTTDKMCALSVLRTLEEMGAIRQADGHWVRPGASKAAKAVSYTVDPLFMGVLEKVHESIVRIGYTGAFLIGLPSKDENNYNHTTTDYSHNRQFSRGVGGITSKSTKKSVSEAYQRRDKIRRLWTAPDENIAKLIEDKARLSCHHVGLGPEASDFAIIEEIRKKYHFSEIEKSCAAADAPLPSGYHTRLNVNVGRDRHGNVHKIGCRPYNALCGTKNEGKPDSIRPEALQELGLDRCHIDVKCSIYTIATALKSGKFVQTDIYSAIAEDLGQERGLVKRLIMKANFGSFAGQAAQSPFCRRAHCKLGGSGIMYGEFQRAMRTHGIDPMGTDTSIFLHEGAIYAIARRMFLENYGIRSICVFDSFYFDAAVGKYLFMQVLNKALAEYLQIIAQ